MFRSDFHAVPNLWCLLGVPNHRLVNSALNNTTRRTKVSLPVIRNLTAMKDK
jgi:hypothetical protein